MSTPSDHGLRIAQMAERTGVSAHTLRYYERIGLVAAVERDAAGRRRYSTADITWVEFLLRLRATGMPISQMRDYAQLRAQGESTVAPRLELLEAHARALKEQIAALTEHQRALAAKIGTYQARLTERDAEASTAQTST